MPEPPPVSPWPMFQQNHARTGVVDAPSIESPRIVWKTYIGKQGWLNNPILVQDRVIVGTQGSRWNKPDSHDGVWALNAQTGEKIWHVHTRQDANSVAYAQGVVVATGDDGQVRGIHWKTGEVLWRHQANAKVYANPLIYRNLAVVANAHGDAFALNLHTGKPAWTQSLKGAVRGGFASHGASGFVGTQDGHIYALNLKTGDILWYRDVNNLATQVSIYATPTVTPHGVVFTYARDTTYPNAGIFLVDAATGTTKWQGDTPDRMMARTKKSWANVRSSPSLYQDLLLFGEAYSKDVVALKAKSGRVGMLATMGDCMFPHWASPIQANQIAYLPRMDGALYAFSHDYGLARWRLHLEPRADGPPSPDEQRNTGCMWSSPTHEPLYATPALSPAGNLYVGSGEGHLFKIADGDRKSVSPL